MRWGPEVVPCLQGHRAAEGSGHHRLHLRVGSLPSSNHQTVKVDRTLAPAITVLTCLRTVPFAKKQAAEYPPRSSQSRTSRAWVGGMCRHRDTHSLGNPTPPSPAPPRVGRDTCGPRTQKTSTAWHPQPKWASGGPGDARGGGVPAWWGS